MEKFGELWRNLGIEYKLIWNFDELWRNLVNFGEIWRTLEKFGELWGKVVKFGEICQFFENSVILLNGSSFLNFLNFFANF